MNNSSIKNINKPIVLVGMMGVGKTTFGKKLASKLKCPFFDLDHEIENEIGHSVSWIFENAGEKEFRKLETKKLEELLSREENIVLALGGGAFISQENRDMIKSNSLSIWLQASAETIFKRVSYRKDRPLLEGVKDKKKHIINLMENREKYYSDSDLNVRTDTGSHRRVIDSILKRLNNLNSSSNSKAS